MQTAVNTQPTPAVEGDFASTNPRYTVMAGPGGLVAAPSGVTVGRFAWLLASPLDADGAPMQASNTGSGPVAGFVHREQQGLITNFLGDASMTVPVGFPVTLFESGDFWVRNNGSGANTLGQKAFASTTDGSVNFAAAGATVTGSVETKWFARSVGAVGEKVKIGDTPLG
jgi:hypothetical protein